MEPDESQNDTTDGDSGGDRPVDDSNLIITEEAQDLSSIPVEPTIAIDSDVTAEILLEKGDDNTVDTMHQQQQTTNSKGEEQQISSQEPHPLQQEQEQEQQQQQQQQPLAFRKVPVRRLKQEEPVVLPGGGSGLENVSMQFGSLNLSNGEEQPIIPQKLSIEERDQDDRQQQYGQNEKQTLTATTTPVPVPSTAFFTNTSTQADVSSSSSSSSTTAAAAGSTAATIISPEVPSDLVNRGTDASVYNSQSQAQLPIHQQPPTQTQPPVQQYNHQYQSYQQPSQQSFPAHHQHYSNDAQVSSYVPYPSNPVPGNGPIHGFAAPGMTAIPDYYNSDYQRSTVKRKP